MKAPVTAGPTLNCATANADRQLLFHDAASGELVAWTVRGTTLKRSRSYGVVPTTWAPVGALETLLVWSNRAVPAIVGWEFPWLGENVAASGAMLAAPSPWALAAVGDAPRSGAVSLLWRHPVSREVVMWAMSGSNTGAALANRVSLGTAPVGWALETAGDLDGDGGVDLFWVDAATGRRVVWLMTGAAVTRIVDLGVVPVTWRLSAVGDLDADGHPDLFWQHASSGALVTWLMNGGAYRRTVSPGGGPAGLGGVPPAWRLVGVRPGLQDPPSGPTSIGIHYKAQLTIETTVDRPRFHGTFGTPNNSPFPVCIPNAGCNAPPYGPALPEDVPLGYRVDWTSSAPQIAAVTPVPGTPIWADVVPLRATTQPVDITATLYSPCEEVIASDVVHVTVHDVASSLGVLSALPASAPTGSTVAITVRVNGSGTPRLPVAGWSVRLSRQTYGQEAAATTDAAGLATLSWTVVSGPNQMLIQSNRTPDVAFTVVGVP